MLSTNYYIVAIYIISWVIEQKIYKIEIYSIRYIDQKINKDEN